MSMLIQPFQRLFEFAQPGSKLVLDGDPERTRGANTTGPSQIRLIRKRPGEPSLALPADVPPGASVGLTSSPTAPSGTTGKLVPEYQLVKEHQFFFNEFADLTVVVT
jgi:hypothetical protein